MKKKVKDISSSSKKHDREKNIYSNSKKSKLKRGFFFKKPTSARGVFLLAGKIIVCLTLLSIIGLSIIISHIVILHASTGVDEPQREVDVFTLVPEGQLGIVMIAEGDVNDCTRILGIGGEVKAAKVTRLSTGCIAIFDGIGEEVTLGNMCPVTVKQVKIIKFHLVTGDVTSP